MAEINKLYESLLPETQQRLTKDWADARYSGEGSSGRLNRYGLGGVAAPSGSEHTASPADPGGAALAGAQIGGSVGGLAGGPVGAGIGAVAGAVGGATVGALDSRKYSKWSPGSSGKAWEERLAEQAPGFADDPYKTTLAMLFMSDERASDPYRFSTDTATKKKSFTWGFRRKKLGRARYWLDEKNRPGQAQEDFVRNSEGFLDWRDYAGSGGDRYRKWAPTWIENMLSRSLYKEHRDLWDKENVRKETWDRKVLNLADKGENFATGTPGNISRDMLGRKA